MKLRSIMLGILAGAMSAIVSSSQVLIADNLADDQYTADRQRADLQDQEKRLLAEEDRLKQDVDQLKHEIAARLDKIDIAQKRLGRLNHDLITLRMKLLP